MKPNRAPLNRRFGRRQLLAGLGAAAALAPFLPLSSRADAGVAPKRLLVFFHPHGTIRSQWLPTGNGTNFELSPILAPLADFKSKLVVVDGLRLYPQGPVGGPHTVGPAWVWTGSRMADSDEFKHDCCAPHGWNTGPSVDQAVAKVIGQSTPFSSLEFGVHTGGYKWPGSRISYADPAKPMDPIDSPLEMYKKLFGSFGIAQEDLDRLRAEQHSVIDLVKGDLTSLGPKMGSQDRIKIEAHLESLRGIEKRIDSISQCTPPGEPMSVDAGANDAIPVVSRLHIDLLVAAFACDLTRVATLQYSVGENSGFRFTWRGIDKGHHELSHGEDGPELLSIYTWYAEEMAYLLQRLSEVDEPGGNGTKLLDNTLVVWGSELAVPQSHAWEPLPFVLAGGAGGAINTGQFLQYNQENHCRLLTSVCQAMGLDVEAFGNLDTGGGALSGLLA